MFRKIEESILNWIKTKYEEKTLSDQIEAITSIKREYTGHGFFIDFILPESVPPLNDSVFKERTISGPNIKSNDIDSGGGSVLFIENGYIKMFELFAYGEIFKEQINDFELLE